MNRRHFIASTAALAVAPLMAQASQSVDYAPGVIEAALSEGKTVFVGYTAKWCGTCKTQERVINALLEEDPSYAEAMTFVRVDWDDFKNHEVTTSRAIPRRSTLLVLRGEEELGRVVAGTSKAQIKALMDLGL